VEWAPRVAPAAGRGRPKGALRLTFADLTSPRLSMLSDPEFRALVLLWAYVAKLCDDGQFERS